MGVDVYWNVWYFQWQVQQYVGFVDVVVFGDVVWQEQCQVGIVYDLWGYCEMWYVQCEIVFYVGVVQYVFGQLVVGGIGVGVDVVQLQQVFYGQWFVGLGMGFVQYVDVVVIEYQLVLVIFGQVWQIVEGQVDVVVVYGGIQIFYGYLLDFDGNVWGSMGQFFYQ